MNPQSVSKNKGQCGMSWNITNRCNLHCKHCLRRCPSLCLPERELSPFDALTVLDLYCDFAREMNFTASVNFLGGNPMMRRDMPDILHRIQKYREEGLINRVSFLANSEQLTPAMIQALADCKTDSYSISLDGLKEMNDYMRGAGNFDSAVSAIRNLRQAGIRVPVKFTLTKENRSELKETILLALELGCSGFGIGQLALQGGGYVFKNLALSAAEYREFLIDIVDIAISIPTAHFDFACGLFNRYGNQIEMIYREENRLAEFEALCRRFPEPDDYLDGFSFGSRHKPQELRDLFRTSFYVWPDGEVNPGHRGNARIGWVPRNTFKELFDLSPYFDDVKRGITPQMRQQINDRVTNICYSCVHKDNCSQRVYSQPDAKRNDFNRFAPQDLYPRQCWILEKEMKDFTIK